MKRKYGLFSDHPKRRALLKFLNASLPTKSKDGRIGLVIAQSFIEGYEKGYARARRSGRRGSAQTKETDL